MDRSTLDRLIASTGLIVAIILVIASGGLLYAHSFIHTQVHDQLAEQKITFPEAGSKALNTLPEADRKAVSKYAGQQLVTGAQAKVFADNYIAVHLDKVADGKTYAEASAAAQANPDDTKLAGQVQTLFRGETLRGMLLNAYAFDTMAVVAKCAAFVALAGGIFLLIFAVLGFYHANAITGKTRTKKRK